MKKILAAALSAAFVMGFAAISSAADETSPVLSKAPSAITLDGSMRFRGYMQTGANKGDNSEDNKSGYDTRVQLGVGAKVADNVNAYLQLETGDDTSDTDTWGGTDGGLMAGGSKHEDGSNDLSIMQAWINYKFDGGGVKIGHMPLALGNKMFFDHTGSGDDAIVVYFDPNSSTHIGLLDVKLKEGKPTKSGDDIEGYVALVTNKVNDSLSVGANLTHLRKNNGPASDTLSAFDGMAMYNLGVTADGKASGLSYKADIELQFGDLNKDIKQSAYAFMASASMDLGGTVVGAELGYGSGDDGSSADKNKGFVNFLTDTRYFTTITGFRLAVPGEDKNSGVSNMTYLQVNANTKTKCPISGKDVAVTGRATYMKLNESSGKDALGTEIDAWATWSLAKNTSYTFEAAYLLAGDAWDTGSGKENAYFVRHGIAVSF